MMDKEFLQSNQKNVINGLLFSNLDGIVMKENEAVRWYIFAVGDEIDLHGAHWHGQTVINEGLRYVVYIYLSIFMFVFPPHSCSSLIIVIGPTVCNYYLLVFILWTCAQITLDVGYFIVIPISTCRQE